MSALIPAAQLEPTAEELAEARAEMARARSVDGVNGREAGRVGPAGRGLAAALASGDLFTVAWLVRRLLATSAAADERVEQIVADLDERARRAAELATGGAR